MNITLVCHKYSVRLDDPCCYPLGFMYVSAVLKAQGHNVKVLNYNLWDFGLAEELKGQDAVFFTGFEEFKPSIIRDAAIAREMGIKTILGGALATFTPDEMLQHVDTVVIGEAENVLTAALQQSGKAYGTKPDLNALPLPDYDGFGVDEYHRRIGYRYMGILTSRGCPYACKFCVQTCRFQKRSLPLVLAEIDAYKEKYKVESIVFNDNTLNLDKWSFLSLCHGMKERRLPWGGAIRADMFDEEMAIAAKEGGAQGFVVGVESLVQNKLDKMNKKLKVSNIYTAFDVLSKHKIPHYGNILLGLPGESYEDILSELAMIPAGMPVYPVMVQPYIGTEYQTRSITQDQYTFLSEKFKQHAIHRGKDYNA